MFKEGDRVRLKDITPPYRGTLVDLVYDGVRAYVRWDENPTFPYVITTDTLESDVDIRFSLPDELFEIK